MKIRLLLTALAAIAFVGCDKEKEDQQSEKTKALVQQSWKFESAGFDLGSDGSVEFNITSQIPPCLADNTITFSADGSGSVDEGASKCESTAPQSKPFTWSFASNETIMNINGNVVAGINGGSFEIVTLNSTQLTLSKDTVYQGIQGAMVASFKH